MLQIEDRAWVKSTLDFWRTATPNRVANRRVIKWNVAQLSAALARLQALEDGKVLEQERRA